jgi:hypothetical protein
MAGYTNDDNNLSTGIPARQIGPETGSSGNATMTNKGSTGEGTNASPDSRPAPAAGLDNPTVTVTGLGEPRRAFGAERMPEAGPYPTDDVESPAQQIADGGDRIDRDQRLDDDKD